MISRSMRAVIVVVALAGIAVVQSLDATTVARLIGRQQDGGISAAPTDPRFAGRISIGTGKGVSAIAVLPDGRSVAVVTSDGVRLYDSGSPATPPHRYAVTEPVRGQIALLPDGHTLRAALVSEAGRTDVVDLDVPELRARPVRSFPGPATLSADGRTVLTSADEQLVQQDVVTGESVKTQVPGLGEAWAVSHDGRRLAVGGRGVVRIVRASDGAVEHILGLPSATADVLTLRFLGDGGRLLVGAIDTPLTVWDVATESAGAVGPPDTDGTRRIVTSGDERRLAVDTGSGPLLLLDGATLAPVGDPLDHPLAPAASAYGPDGDELFSASEDGLIRRWRLGGP